MTLSPCFVGIDISKTHLDLCVLTDEREHYSRLDNDVAGHAVLCAQMRRHSPVSIVLEASGGYERACLGALQAANLPIARINPRQVRDFGRASGVLAKTDRLDARLLARYAATFRPEPTAPVGWTVERIRAFVIRRRQLRAMRAAESCRKHQAVFNDLRCEIERSIDQLTEDINAINRQIRDLLKHDQVLSQRAALLGSVPGVGPVAVMTLIAELPELGSLTKRQIAALVGVAPFACESGQWRGRRRCAGGRKSIRDALFMPTLVAATRTNSPFAQCYQRLRDAGKPSKVALIAVMRKLIVTLNAIARDNRKYEN